MADVFISYRKADRTRAEALAKALKIENLDVWWDTALETGETFDEKIQAVLEKCKAVIVLWSKESVKSDWVRAESSIGRERGILVPVMIQPVNIPVPFNLLHTADLIGWNGDRSHPGYRDVVKQVKELAGKTNVKPLKPPPNRELRALWRAVAAVAVIAVIGASAWVVRPWEYFRSETVAALEAEEEAKTEALDQRQASLEKLTAYGLQPGDLDRYQPFELAMKRFDASKRDQLMQEAPASGDPILLSLRCAVSMHGAGNHQADAENFLAWCGEADKAGDATGALFYGYAMQEESLYIGADTEALQAAAVGQFRKAADMGSALGMVEYGQRLRDGEGVDKDAAAAQNLFKQAQATGLPAADRALGRLWLSGEVAGPSDAEAFALVRKAADAGDIEAQRLMADKLVEAMHMAEDLPAALAYYKACALSGDPLHAFWCEKQIPFLEERLAPSDPAPP